MKINGYIVCVCALILSACSNHKIVGEYEKPCTIYPDYMGVTIPYNIAPLNFEIDGVKGGFVHLYAPAIEEELFVKIKGGKISIPEKRWHKFLENLKDGNITVTIVNEEHYAYPQFVIRVVPDPIDRYAVYRLIEPGYQFWGEMGLYQRDLESFKQIAIVENKDLENACVNCHSFANNSTDNMLFHVRTTDYGGTYIRLEGGELTKLNTRTPFTISALVYPSWHPSGKYVAFSVNDTHQTFYFTDPDKIEVFDNSSDVVVYNTETHELTTAPQLFSDSYFETFPTFTPDGKRLIFCSAEAKQMPRKYDEVHYNLCAIDFDPETGEFGDVVDTLVNARKMNKSVSFPRVSPDGKYILFTLCKYGNFSIWHKDATLYIYELRRGLMHSAVRWNSTDVESYHSWSSNSRWVLFSSRRDDGLYTRLYIGYIGEDGKLGKAFMLPQRDPEQNKRFMKSYNIPELITTPLKSMAFDVRNPNAEATVRFATDLTGFDIDSTRMEQLIDAATGATTMENAIN